MHGWMQMELGGELKILGQRVISVQHLAGVRDIMRMETGESSLSETVQSSMSSTFMNCIEAGLQVDKETVKEKYGLTEESIRLYVPVECPKDARHRILAAPGIGPAAHPEGGVLERGGDLRQGVCRHEKRREVHGRGDDRGVLPGHEDARHVCGCDAARVAAQGEEKKFILLI